MGLDMYLERAKRIDGATPKDVNRIDEYFSYCLRPSKYRNCTMKEWCGVDIKDVDMDLADAYREEYQTRYYGWDNKEKYPHLSLWDGVGYWRKANQIHCWFVENVQDGIDDCGTYEVTEKQLVELLNTCKEVKAHSKLVDGKVQNGMRATKNGWEPIMEDGQYIEDPTVAQELLPTTSGFFFGSEGYDQWYMADIDYTIETLTKVLEETDFETEMVCYSASW